MMLVQKPPQLPSNPPYSHRRHPSAPPQTVVVQATRTPGLLSLSKPSRPSPNRHQQHQQPRQIRTSKSKPVPLHLRHPSPPDHHNTSPHPPVLSLDKKPTLAHTSAPTSQNPSPDRNLRGRSHAKPPKDLSNRRSASHSSPRGPRRNNNRQPSPPLQPTSQAEGSIHTAPNSLSQSFSHRIRKPHSNPFDPFLVNSTSDSDSGSDTARRPKPSRASRSAPKLASLPSGKLARRRHPIPEPFASPTPPSKAVPVARPVSKSHAPNISRSEPLSSHMPPRPRKSSVEWESFPICDDSDDVTPPSTPIRPRQLINLDTLSSTFDDGPRTAPLSSTSGFPFGKLTTPNFSSRTRHHQRTPSEGVFSMSFDDDTPSSRSPEELRAFFGISKDSPSRAIKDKAGYFASSNFQNSPNPEELPPPRFGALA